MQMADFIESNLEAIVGEWEAFAATQRPAAAHMTPEELRNLSGSILRTIAADMRKGQSEAQRHEKSLGERPVEERTDIVAAAHAHAAERLTHGFTLNQLIAEYRALRANVTRRWRAEIDAVGEQELEELSRFHEALDVALTESVDWYSASIEKARYLLTGILAHDLRSPLGAILAAAEVQLRDETLSTDQTRIALRVRNSAKRIGNMVDDLLDSTRTRLGTELPITTGDCNMGDILQVILEEQRAHHPGTTIGSETSGDLVGRWDQSRIEQMLANLIGNAIEHGGQSPVKVIAEGRDDEVTVKIHNECGFIAEQEQRVIFDPLRRATISHDHDTRVGADLGLGLYIALQIAEAHGGTIEVTSSEGEGTTFTVRLPRQHSKGAEMVGVT